MAFTYPSSSRSCTFRPYLHTSRLTLEIMDERNPVHIDESLKILNDSANIAAMGDYGIKTPDQHQILSSATVLLPQHLPAGKSPSGYLGYVVRLGTRPDGEIVGLITLASRSEDVPPDIGWGFHSAHHGRGYATEAAREVLRYLMHELQGGFLLAKPHPIGIIAWPNPSNRGSVRVAEKIGMVNMGNITGDDGVEVVYGVPELLGDRRFTKGTVVSFYGPGEIGQRCKAALLGS